MKRLNLYAIKSETGRTMIAAHSHHQAADIFTTWQAAQEREPGDFSIDPVSLDSFAPEQQGQIRDALEVGQGGIVNFDDESGWTIHWDGWISDDPDDEENGSILRIFQFRDHLGIDGYVLAADYERAGELLRKYLRAYGGDPDTIHLRELLLQQIEDEAANDAVNEALDIGWEGVSACDAEGGWTFTTPLGRWSGTYAPEV